MENKTFCAMELRTKGKTIVGLVPFNSPSEDLGGWLEILRPGCFSETLENGRDVKSFWNHDTGKVLGSTKAGTLKLEERSNGLHIKLFPPSNTWGADALESVRRGDTTGFSFGFTIKPDGENWADKNIRELTNVELYEVSPTAMPAFAGSQAMVRSRRNDMEENFDDIQRQHKTLDKMTPVEIENYLEGRRQIDAIKCSMIEPSGEKVNNRTGGFRSMGEFLQSVARYHAGGGMDRRLENRYLKEGTGSAGGFLLQPEYINEIMQSVWSSGELLKRVWSIPMQTNTLKIPAIDESSRATGSRWGGAQAYWIDEGGTKQESEPKFRRIELNLNKAVVLIPATDEVLEDAQALEAVIKSVAAKEITFCLEDAILNGTGAGRPLGIINAGATVTVSKETGQAASTVVFENIVKMWARMKEDSLANAVWFINQTVWPELFNMYLAVGTGGSAVYLPGGGLSEAPYGTLMGKPVIPIEQCQALGTAGDIILADMSKYVWAYRELQSAMSIHVYFTTDKSVFRFVARVDGQPILASPITPYKGGSSNTLSDFVILESRT